MLPATDTGLRRVSVHWDAAVIDVALHAKIPVAVLIPSIVDILEIGHPDNEAERYQLSVPGHSALDPSMTLTQHRIGDGAILLLSRCGVPLPAPRYVDVAQAVSATLGAVARPHNGFRHDRAVRLTAATAAIASAGIGGLVIVRNTFSAGATGEVASTVTVLVAAGILALGLAALAHRSHRDQTAGLTLSAIATVFAAVAGFVAVPGEPGVCNVLLSAAAVGATAIVAIRVSGCGVVTLTAVACCAVIVAAAGLAGVISDAAPRAIASVAALVCLALLGVAARASIALAGLSPRPGTPDVAEVEPSGAWLSPKAVSADRWLVSLLGGLSGAAAVGAVITVLAGAPGPACTAFGTLTGALLLLRARSAEARRMLVFAASGFVIVATTFVVAAARTPVHNSWVATATTVAVAMCLGFVTPPRPLSPVLRRSAGMLEWLMLAVMVPLTCWICGLYGAVRGLSLT